MRQADQAPSSCATTDVAAARPKLLSCVLRDREAVHAVAVRLDELGVSHSGVKDLGRAMLLEFRDPDALTLEVYATAG